MDRRSDPKLKGMNGMLSSKKQQRDGESCQNGVESSFIAVCRCGQIDINSDCKRDSKCYRQMFDEFMQ